MKPFLKAVKSIASRFRLARRSTAALSSGLTLNNSLTAKPDILARFFQAVQQRVFTLCRPTQPRHRPRHLEKHTQATKERDYSTDIQTMQKGAARIFSGHPKNGAVLPGRAACHPTQGVATYSCSSVVSLICWSAK